MKKIDILKNLKTKVLASTVAATVMAASPVSASAEKISAQDLLDQLINGKSITLDEAEASYIDAIEQAVRMNGANLLGEEVNETYSNLLQGKYSDVAEKTEVLMDLATQMDYLLDLDYNMTYPRSIQIEQVANYTCNELKTLGVSEIPSRYRYELTGQMQTITPSAVINKAKDNRELKEETYVIINAMDRGYYDDKCYEDVNPHTGVDYTADITMLAAEAALIGLTFKSKKEQKGKEKVKTR